MRRALVLLLLCAAPLRAEWAPNDPLPLDPDLRHFRLDNGLSVYIRANGEPQNRISLQLVVNAGSILEDDSQRGLAHFLEHMAFNGTEHFAKQELIAYMEAIGMEFGADVNAYTNFDETVYMLELPADSEQFLDQGLLILRDWADAITLDPAEIEKERGVVIEEWRLRQGAGQRISDQQLPVLLKGSRYPERLPIGLPEILRSAPPSELARFYDDWYRSDLMAIVAVGEFDVDAMERRIRERFADLAQAATGARERIEHDIPMLDDRNVSIVADPEATQARLSIQVKLPARAEHTVAGLRADLIEGLCTQMLNMRLGELVQKPDPPFIFAGGYTGALMRARRHFTLSCTPRADAFLSGARAALIEWERVVRHGFTPGELERAKAIALRRAQSEFAERENIESARWAAEHRAHFLDGDVSMSVADYWSLMQQLVPSITLAEVEQVAPAIWSQANRTLLASAPAGSPLPGEAELLALLDEVAAQSIEPYVDEVGSGRILSRTPQPGSIVAEHTHAALGIHEWTLSNGIRVFVKPTDFREDEILIQAASPGGHSLVADADFEQALLASMFADVGGIGELDAIALGKALAGKRVGLRLSVNELGEWIRGGAAPQDLELFFELLYASLLEPRDDAAAAKALQERQIAALRNQSLSPESAFSDTLQAVLSQYHPRRPLFDAALVERFDYARAMPVFRERFADLDEFTFVIVGRVDLDALRPLVTRYLASLPSLPRQDHWRDVGVREPDGVVERVVRAGREPKASVAVVFHGDFPWDDRAQRYRLGALSSLLQIRLRDALREELGGTYGVRVMAAPERDPVPSYQFRIQFGCDPARVDEMLAELWRSLRTLKAEGPSPANVAKVQEQDRRSYEESQEDNGWWLAQIAYRVQYGLPLAEIQDYLPLVDALKPEQLQEAARHYLDETNSVRVTLLPAAD